MDKKLEIIDTDFEDLKVIKPIAYKDIRGEFSRIYCSDELTKYFSTDIKQINHSMTNEKGTVRGFHFQYHPNNEIKIIKCIKGKILDVVIDIRENSKTFLQSFLIELSQENQKMILIPNGFAHGFQTLENNTELLYLHSEVYTPHNEGALNVNDPKLKISWPLPIINLSKKDQTHPYINKDFKGIKINEL